MDELNKMPYFPDLQEDSDMPYFTCETNFDFQQSTRKEVVIYFDSERSSKPLFVHFWATWCGEGVKGLPGLQKLFDKYHEKVDFIFINCGERRKEINNFLKSNNYNFPVGFDEENKLSYLFGVRSIPTTIVASTWGGFIEHIVVGSRTQGQYKRLIKRYIKRR